MEMDWEITTRLFLDGFLSSLAGFAILQGAKIALLPRRSMIVAFASAHALFLSILAVFAFAVGMNDNNYHLVYYLLFFTCLLSQCTSVPLLIVYFTGNGELFDMASFFSALGDAGFFAFLNLGVYGLPWVGNLEFVRQCAWIFAALAIKMPRPHAPTHNLKAMEAVEVQEAEEKV